MKLKLPLLLLTLTFITYAYGQSGFPFDNEIREFKHQDSLNFPKPNGILFIGSSSIRIWSDLQERFPDAPIIRRGIGGSEIAQLVNYYTPYVLFPYHPRKIFIYDGENDIAIGKSGAFVAEEFAKLWDMIRQKLPDAEVYYLSIKPSPSRIKYLSEMTDGNNRIKTFLSNKPKGHYVDLSSVIYKKGTSLPDSSLFRADYLHLKKWAKKPGGLTLKYLRMLHSN